VPCLIRGPGIPAGTVCDQLTGTIDVLPTIAAITGKALPKANKIDGIDVSGLWTAKTDQSPRSEFVHYTSQGNLEGIRQGDWKLLVKKPRRRPNQKKAAAKPAQPQVLLFDLSKDIGEQNNLAQQHPEIVKRLQQRMQELDDEITKNARAPWSKG
jgi:arylsulfatase A